jgi:hypothetical protein
MAKAEEERCKCCWRMLERRACHQSTGQRQPHPLWGRSLRPALAGVDCTAKTAEATKKKTISRQVRLMVQSLRLRVHFRRISRCSAGRKTRIALLPALATYMLPRPWPDASPFSFSDLCQRLISAEALKMLHLFPSVVPRPGLYRLGLLNRPLAAKFTRNRTH